MYYFLPLSTFGYAGEDSTAFSTNLLEQTGVATIPGAAFGAEGYVRMSFGGMKEEIEAGLKELYDHIQTERRRI